MCTHIQAHTLAMHDDTCMGVEKHLPDIYSTLAPWNRTHDT